MDLNRIQLTGRLLREPLLYDIGDHHVAALFLICERSWRTRAGALERAQDCYRLTAWEELADACGRHLHADDHIYITGQLRLFTSYTEAMEHSTHEILLDQVLLLASGAARPESLYPSSPRSASGRSVVALPSHLVAQGVVDILRKEQAE
jgi:single-stranded DNA-binding protein